MGRNLSAQEILRKYLFVTTILLAFPAKSAAQTYQVHGAGAKSCGLWSEYRIQRNPLAGVMETWVQGYLSAFNALSAVNGHGADLAAGTDDDGVFRWIDNYCATHPLDPLSSAAAELIAELDRRAAAARP